MGGAPPLESRARASCGAEMRNFEGLHFLILDEQWNLSRVLIWSEKEDPKNFGSAKLVGSEVRGL